MISDAEGYCLFSDKKQGKGRKIVLSGWPGGETGLIRGGVID